MTINLINEAKQYVNKVYGIFVGETQKKESEQHFMMGVWWAVNNLEFKEDSKQRIEVLRQILQYQSNRVVELKEKK
jgi:hypothetical protein